MVADMPGPFERNVSEAFGGVVGAGWVDSPVSVSASVGDTAAAGEDGVVGVKVASDDASSVGDGHVAFQHR